MRPWLTALASPKLSAFFFVVMAAAALWAKEPGRNITLAMLVPFSLLALNLVAAIVTNRRFRADLPLLVFHLALLALILALAVARLTYFEGQATVTAGTSFDGSLIAEERGPLHDRTIGSLRFSNLGFTENYPERGRYHTTYNRVRWQGKDGRTHVAEIGDDIPLIVDGYRIYTSRYRGYSPVFRWQAADGSEDWGTVQLSESNNGAFAGANEWTMPDGRTAWLMVDAETPAPTEGASVRPNLGAGSEARQLILRIGDSRHVLTPGDQLPLASGLLTYVRLDSWMGYRIISDPTRPWLIGAALLGVLSLVGFYSRVLLRPLPSASSLP